MSLISKINEGFAFLYSQIQSLVQSIADVNTRIDQLPTGGEGMTDAERQMLQDAHAAATEAATKATQILAQLETYDADLTGGLNSVRTLVAEAKSELSTAIGTNATAIATLTGRVDTLESGGGITLPGQ